MCVMKMILDLPKYILGGPGAVSRVGRKGATKVFKDGRKRPWVPTLTRPFQTVKRMLAPDWAQKNASYYCAQSANSRLTAPGFPRMAKVGRQKGSTERTRLIFRHRPQTSLFNKQFIILSDMA